VKIEIENAKTDGTNLSKVDEEDIGYRVVTVDDKYKFSLRSKDPYGYITVSTTAGRTPKEFEGQFTDISAALNAIKAYVNRKISEENKPPRDKNTRKIKELLDNRDASITA
jgi:hypothetical protein